MKLSGVSYLICALVVLTLVALGVVGYIKNIVDIVHATGFSFGLIVRIIGIFVPFVGAVAGWF